SIITKIITSILIDDNFKNHFKLAPNTVSSELFKNYLKNLDPNRLYFTKKNIDFLKNSIKTSLYEEIEEGNTEFAFRAYNLFIRKVKKRTEFAKNLLKQKFNFNTDESYNFDRSEVSWAKNEKVLDKIWRKKIKNELLTFQLMDKIAKENQSLQSKPMTETAKDKKSKSKESKNKTRNKKKVDNKSIGKNRTPKQRIIKRLDSYLNYLEKNKPIKILEIYLNSFTHIYDPHSSYMSPHTEENFNIQMKLSFVGIGAYLSDDNGYIKIERIIPGGPADKSDNLHAGDRIIGVGDKKSRIINVIDMPISDVVTKIRGKKGTPVYLNILPAEEGIHGIPRTIKIIRGIVKLKDAEAHDQIIEKETEKGEKLKIGIINIPSFYYDFKAASDNKKNLKCSTSDVKKIIKKLKKKNIDGLIIDLRANGGGSLKDAIDLTGLFVKKGPIVQIKNHNNEIHIERDKDEECIYEGPLLVLVSKLSASAAEIFAGAMKDYNRAVIVGDKSTHGKGTVQTVFALDRLVKPFNFLDCKLGAIKLTNAMFYRINGSSTQLKGVIPDITFNSFTNSLNIGEKELDHALPWDYIAPVPHKDYKVIKPYIKLLNMKSQNRRKNDKDFQKLNKLLDMYEKLKNRKEVSLNRHKRIEKYKKEKKLLSSQKKILKSTISQKNAKEKSVDDMLSDDLLLRESVNIMSDYISILRNGKNKKIVKKN
ncbi:MAG: carboxy terminal-processing peptidase, partial [Victivallales bacterium]|nr:carboxy terminal-processing peptidase [Victivallales bacterium]